MEKTIRGSLGAASAFQLTKDMEALDKQSRKILQYREVLAVILKETVEEYQEYSGEEIMAFIEADSITEGTEVSGGRTNTKIDGAATEFAELGAWEETHMTGLGQSIYEEGIEEGIEKGSELTLFLLVCKKLAKGKKVQEIAEMLEEPESVIRMLCEKAEAYAPEYDEKKIREGWRSWGENNMG